MFLQQFERKFIVALRQSAVAHHVGKHDCGEFALFAICTHDSVNVAPFQLGEEIVDLHFGFSSQSFWKRGSFRSGSNIGSSRSSAGGSGTPPASALSYGIESRFCKAT